MGVNFPAAFTEFFGPSMWKTLHAISFTYPPHPTPEQRRQYLDFFTAVGPVIPCPACALHYQEYLQNNPILAENTDDLAMWVYKLHDEVNRRNGKTSPTFEEIKSDYAGYDQKRHDELNKLSKNEQLRALMDPTFGRAEYSLKENAHSAFEKKWLGLGIILLCIVVTLTIFYSRAVKKK